MPTEELNESIMNAYLTRALQIQSQLEEISRASDVKRHRKQLVELETELIYIAKKVEELKKEEI